MSSDLELLEADQSQTWYSRSEESFFIRKICQSDRQSLRERDPENLILRQLPGLVPAKLSSDGRGIDTPLAPYGDLRQFLAVQQNPAYPFRFSDEPERKSNEQFSITREEFYVRTMYQIALALNQIHLAGRVYRDLKPSNILVFQGLFVLLNDFGTCRAILSDSVNVTPTSSGPYTAPEQKDSPDETNSKSDIYSFGKILFDLMYLLYPKDSLEIKSFKENYKDQIMIEGTDEDTHALIQVTLDNFLQDELVKPDIKELVLFGKRCVNFNPSQRPENLNEIIDYFQRRYAAFCEKVNCYLARIALSPVAYRSTSEDLQQAAGEGGFLADYYLAKLHQSTSSLGNLALAIISRQDTPSISH